MSLIKKDKSVLDLFRKKEVKTIMSKRQLDSLGIKVDSSQKPKSNFVGLSIYVIFVVIVIFAGAYLISPYVPTEQVLAYKMIVGLYCSYYLLVYAIHERR